MGPAPIRNALRLFRRHDGVLHTKQALELGVHPRTLYAMRDRGLVEQLSRGVYRLSSLPPLSQPDLATVALRVPQAVVCLISALAYHDITTEVPHEVQIALPRGTKTPVLEHPPLRVFRFSGQALTEGIQTVSVDKIPLRVYAPEKTVADCFRFRKKLGLDVALEALDLCIKRKRTKPVDLLSYARICRVEKVMLPYLEARR
jgi:predicted transcriptional regulator of viral defense system